MDEKYNMVVQSSKNGRMVQCPFWACAEKNGKLFFSAWLLNGLFCMDLESGRITFLKRFETEKEKEKYLHQFAFVYDNEIWFIPAYGESITVVDFSNFVMRKIELPDCNRNINTEKFCACIPTGEKEVWLLPGSYGEILKINLEKREIKKIENRKQISTGKQMPQFVDAVKVDNEIWLCPYMAREMVILDTQREKMRKENWEYEPCSFQKMLYDGQNIWLIPDIKYSYLVKWDVRTGEKKEIAFSPRLTERGSVGYYTAAIWDNHIWLAPFEAENFVSINISTNEIEEVTALYKAACLFGWKRERYQIAVELEKRILFLSDWQGIAMLCYDKTNGNIIFYELAIEKEELEKYLQVTLNERKTLEGTVFFNEEGALLENMMPLEYYGELIKKPQTVMRQIFETGLQEKMTRSNGEKIWEYLKRDIQDR